MVPQKPLDHVLPHRWTPYERQCSPCLQTDSSVAFSVPLLLPLPYQSEFLWSTSQIQIILSQLNVTLKKDQWIECDIKLVEWLELCVWAKNQIMDIL